MTQITNGNGEVVWEGDDLSKVLDVPEQGDSDEALDAKAENNAKTIAKLKPLKQPPVNPSPWGVVNARTGEVEQRHSTKKSAEAAVEPSIAASVEHTKKDIDPDTDRPIPEPPVLYVEKQE